MATLNVNGQKVTVDDSFLRLSPEQQNATVEEIAGSLKPAAPEGFMANAMDLIKSIPRGLVKGATSAQNPSFVPLEDVNLEMAPIREGAAKTLVNQTYAPRGPFGKGGEAIGEGLGNPISYLGPGSLPLKVGASALSSAAGEAGAQGAEALGGGQGAQTATRLLTGVAGGVAGAKAFGPGAPKAATPTLPELETASKTGGKFGGYKAARESELELDPKGMASWAEETSQKLYGRDFSSGKNGTAPRTFAVLDDLQSPPSAGTPPRFLGPAVYTGTSVAPVGVAEIPKGPSITPANLAALKEKLQVIAQETRQTQGGAVVATKDAAAASDALKRLGEYVENIPASHVLGGDAAAYSNAIKEATANNAAFQRGRDFDARVTKAERMVDRQIAGSLDSKIKEKAGGLLDSAKSRGLSDAELAQLNLINSGGPASNTLRQLGRAGAGVVPLGAQAGLAVATGGTHLVPQATLAAALYGARRISQAITESRASKLAEMLAQRSPLYEQRKASLPAADTTIGTSALLRALLGH